MNENTTLLTFPCHFPIKIIGINTSNFVSEIKDIIHRYYPDTSPKQIHYTLSENNKYLSITVTVYALEKQTLDEFYQAISRHPNIKMVL